jgi:hypothetical protein
VVKLRRTEAAQRIRVEEGRDIAPPHRLDRVEGALHHLLGSLAWSGVLGGAWGSGHGEETGKQKGQSNQVWVLSGWSPTAPAQQQGGTSRRQEKG